MKAHLTIPFTVFVTLLTAAMATGSPLLYLLALLTALTVMLCFFGVLWAGTTIRISAEITEETVHRGDTADLLLQVRHRGWIPIAPDDPAAEHARTDTENPHSAACGTCRLFFRGRTELHLGGSAGYFPQEDRSLRNYVFTDGAAADF